MHLGEGVGRQACNIKNNKGNRLFFILFIHVKKIPEITTFLQL